jgi:ribonuclease BN (tRNA processing enzyme)
VSCNGCTVAYSGDTAWTDALLEAACDADLFLCEASSFATPIPYHLMYQTIAAHRKDIRASRLVLTHLGPEMLSRRSKLAVECATDGQRIAVRRRAAGHSRR